MSMERPLGIQKSKNIWQYAFSQLIKDKYVVLSLFILFIYIVVGFGSGLGLFASSWSQPVGASYGAPSSEHWFGLDIFGRSVLAKTIKGTEIAMIVGTLTAVLATVIGLTLGALAGYFGGKVDEFIVWFYTTVSSIPYIMLLIAITFILGKGMLAVYMALGLTSWESLCRVVRGEVMRHKDREYVQGALAIGSGHFRRLVIHIIPNVFHVVIINFSLTFQTAIKSEVILSYLGLGVQGEPSWGTMIDDSKLELARGVWWQLGAATLAMVIILLAVNAIGDALRDALDPKLKGK